MVIDGANNVRLIWGIAPTKFSNANYAPEGSPGAPTPQAGLEFLLKLVDV